MIFLTEEAIRTFNAFISSLIKSMISPYVLGREEEVHHWMLVTQFVINVSYVGWVVDQDYLNFDRLNEVHQRDERIFVSLFECPESAQVSHIQFLYIFFSINHSPTTIIFDRVCRSESPFLL